MDSGAIHLMGSLPLEATKYKFSINYNKYVTEHNTNHTQITEKNLVYMQKSTFIIILFFNPSR